MIARLVEFCARRAWLTLGVIALLCVWAFASLRSLPIDAIPDLSDTQVIIDTPWERSPDIVEDQVTYPISRALLGAPKVKSIRGFSDFGHSYVYVIFEDGTDLYWARSRVLEQMSALRTQLPAGVEPRLGPDATGVGWVYQYALVDESKSMDLAELRSLQDFNLKYALQSVPGVAEVASVGGQVRQLQVRVNPLKLQAYNIGLNDVVRAVKAGNLETGARVLEFSGFEFMVRGRGYAQGPDDIGAIALRPDPKTGAVLRVRDVADVGWGADMRRGVTDLDGEGDAVGGIIVMRQGENAPAVIDRVKARLEELKPGLPKGLKILPVYDRSDLIRRAINTISHELILEIIVVSLIIMLFLQHFASALIPILTLPIAVLLAFIPMHLMGVSANIMSLAGIAVAIGAMVDASIVVVENSHKRLEQWVAGGRLGDSREVLIKAIQEVARPSFFSLLVIAVSFAPVFFLPGQAGRLFSPLAFTKNLSMFVAALMAITLDPALRLAVIRVEPYRFAWGWLTRLANRLLVGEMVREEDQALNRWLHRRYEPWVARVLAYPKRSLLIAVGLLALTIIPFLKLGSEFMPSLDEGDLLYMPTALPGMSANQAQEILQRQDAILKSYPEVERVFGKAGRAETATDIAPFSMVETTVMLKPRHEWREKPRWYSGWLPGFLKPLVRWAWDDRPTTLELARQMDKDLKFAGIPNIWTMPIKNRLDMLSTGVRTPLGIKVLGPDLESIQITAEQVESVLRPLTGTATVFAERATGGYFVDVEWDRERLGFYGLSIEEAQMTLMAALGGDSVTTIVRGRERYGVGVRYQSSFRDDITDVEHVILRSMTGMSSAQIALGSVAKIRRLKGPAMIRNEDGQLAAYVYVDVADVDLGSYVKKAKALVDAQVKPQPGVSVRFSGQYEQMQQMWSTLAWVLPLVALLIVILLYLNSRSWTRVVIILLAVPFSLIGAYWLLWLLGYNMSTAVAVGLIALAGLDAETGMFMLLYLELSYDDAEAKGRFKGLSGPAARAALDAELRHAVHDGAVKRLRPKVMTVATAFIGLLPVMMGTGSGADVMRRIAAPMVGGLASSFLLELLIYPAVFYLWKWKCDLEPLVSERPAQGFWAFVKRLG